jgi:hypothetical protein
MDVMNQSRWGVASVAFSVLAVAASLLAVVLYLVFGVHGDTPPPGVFSAVAICLLSLLMGLSCGIVGVAQQDKPRSAAMAGLAISGSLLLFFVLWTGIGR